MEEERLGLCSDAKETWLTDPIEKNQWRPGIRASRYCEGRGGVCQMYRRTPSDSGPIKAQRMKDLQLFLSIKLKQRLRSLPKQKGNRSKKADGRQGQQHSATRKENWEEWKDLGACNRVRPRREDGDTQEKKWGT